MSFQWSLQPMLTWMRCIGIYLESPDNKVSFCRFRCLITCFGVIVFFVNIFLNSMSVVTFAVYLGKSQTWAILKSKRFTSTRIWSQVITALNHSFLIAGSHTSLLMPAYSKKWLELIEVLREMEKDKIFEPKDYERFRSVFVFGFGLLVTVLLTEYFYKIIPLNIRLK